MLSRSNWGSYCCFFRLLAVAMLPTLSFCDSGANHNTTGKCKEVKLERLPISTLEIYVSESFALYSFSGLKS